MKTLGEAVVELTRIGFRFRLEGETVKVRFAGKIRPETRRVKDLLDILKKPTGRSAGVFALLLSEMRRGGFRGGPMLPVRLAPSGPAGSGPGTGPQRGDPCLREMRPL
jgi:hypothetical protein